jgi:hypothetical protein
MGTAISRFMAAPRYVASVVGVISRFMMKTPAVAEHDPTQQRKPVSKFMEIGPAEPQRPKPRDFKPP